MKISVALCTFNGETHLPEQLKSISEQTHLPDELVICDDGSTDSTLEILDKFSQTAPFVTRICSNDKNLGPSRNFAKSIDLCKGQWIFLCDQDDFWLPNKIDISAQKMVSMEERFGSNQPLLVHTDAIVTDENLQKLHSSVWAFQHSFPQKGHTLAKLLSQNLVTGCTAVINRALKDKALPIPNNAMMHDWWLALVATTFGQIDCITEPTILYRQHGKNDTGAKPWGLIKALSSLFDTKNKDYILKKEKDISARIRKQAKEFQEYFGKELSDSQQKMLTAFIELPNYSFLVRKYLILRYGLHYQGFLRNIGNLLLK